MQIIRFFLFSLILSSTAFSLAGANEAHLTDKIDRLENQVLTLEQRIADLQQNQNSQNGPSDSASIHARLLGVEEKMRELNGKSESDEHALQQFSDRLRNLSADIDMRFSQIEQKGARSAPVVTGSDLAVTTTAPVMPAASDSTFDKYKEQITAGHYSKAIAGLEKYITNNKDNPKSGEAYYMIGGAYAKQKLYDKAAVSYLKGYKTYPHSDKAADSLLNLSRSLSKLNKKEKACEILGKLEAEYPNRSEANKKHTIEVVGKLGCNAKTQN